MVLNAAELVSMESILFLSAMFQACQFQFSPKYNHTTRTHTQTHTHTDTNVPRFILHATLSQTGKCYHKQCTYLHDHLFCLEKYFKNKNILPVGTPPPPFVYIKGNRIFSRI